MSNQFRRGEIAIYIGPSRGRVSGCLAPWAYGEEVKIAAVVSDNEKLGYNINHRKFWYDIEGSTIMVAETSLRKRPDDKPFTSWFEKTILTDCLPVQDTIESTMRHVARNLEQFAGRGK